MNRFVFPSRKPKHLSQQRFFLETYGSFRAFKDFSQTSAFDVFVRNFLHMLFQSFPIQPSICFALNKLPYMCFKVCGLQSDLSSNFTTWPQCHIWLLENEKLSAYRIHILFSGVNWQTQLDIYVSIVNFYTFGPLNLEKTKVREAMAVKCMTCDGKSISQKIKTNNLSLWYNYEVDFILNILDCIA